MSIQCAIKSEVLVTAVAFRKSCYTKIHKCRLIVITIFSFKIHLKYQNKPQWKLGTQTGTKEVLLNKLYFGCTLARQLIFFIHRYLIKCMMALNRSMCDQSKYSWLFAKGGRDINDFYPLQFSPEDNKNNRTINLLSFAPQKTFSCRKPV